MCVVTTTTTTLVIAIRRLHMFCLRLVLGVPST